MALRTAWVPPGERTVRLLAGWAGLALLAAVAACAPGIEAWRALSGINKNDPDPATAPYTSNMAAADDAPYPNLASVPAPPNRASSAAERQKLTQALMAERLAAAPVGAAVTAAAEPASVAPPPQASRPAARPEEAQTPPRNIAARTDPRLDNPTLQVPQVRSLPEPDSARPAPPPPRLAPVPPPAAALAPAPIAGAAPQPPPPLPTLNPIPPPAPPAMGVPPPPPAAAFVRTDPKLSPAPVTVATFATMDRGEIERVAARYRERVAERPGEEAAGAVRVIAYAPPPAPGGDPLGAYHAALERARAVADALAQAGVPASRIRAEAAPNSAVGAAASIEIQFLF